MVKIDAHITTCHRHDVKCRPRPAEAGAPYGWNVTEWTPEERLEISKISVESIIRFVRNSPGDHDIRLSILDDGSDYQPALDWLDELSERDDIEVVRGPASGSAATINRYIDTVDEDTDLICHFEDDNLAFNPLKLDWIQTVHDRFNSAGDSLGVITFRSGLPTSDEDRGYKGTWGPKCTTNIGEPIFYMMGNAHHVMPYSVYKKFMPLQGNTGGCEAQMCNRMNQLGYYNIELQEFLYMFHTHKLKSEDPFTDLEMWNKTGEGFEFGMKSMHKHLTKRKKVLASRFKNFPGQRENLLLDNYDY